MQRSQWVGSFLVATALGCLLLTAAHSQLKAAKPAKLLKTTRQSSTDLEVSGLLAGVTSSSHRFIRYSDLLKLPQVKATITGDENFADMHTATVHVSGVSLEVLSRMIGVAPSATFITGLCTDEYLGIFSADYLAAHQPILVLKINDLSYANWARKTHNQDPGPYLITSTKFTPAYHVLAYGEQPQVPENMVSLSFNAPQALEAAIAPAARFTSDSPQQLGFAIARVTCLKCHNVGDIGGTKAHRPWSKLIADATADPATFAKRIANPKSVDPKAAMPANEAFDTATLAALTAYFQSLSTE